jgi:hypothetical protein
MDTWFLIHCNRCIFIRKSTQAIFWWYFRNNTTKLFLVMGSFSFSDNSLVLTRRFYFQNQNISHLETTLYPKKFNLFYHLTNSRGMSSSLNANNFANPMAMMEPGASVWLGKIATFRGGTESWLRKKREKLRIF